MFTVADIKLSFGEQLLFEDVNIKFIPGNCYGLIGANGAGKSSFLKILAGTIEVDKGTVAMPKTERLAVLEQNQFAYDEFTVLATVLQGYKRLYQLMREKDALYSKEDFSAEDGLIVAELENEFAELGGWEAESEAAQLLAGLGIAPDLHDTKMADLESSVKLRVLLAQALFANPDNLLLDEPTNNLDIESIRWLEDFLYKFENTVIVVSHDRHFLNKVCTHIVDIDFNKLQLYTGNYDFWRQVSEITMQQSRDKKKRAEDRARELKTFIQRFSANASKSKQATSRKKELEKLSLDDLPHSTRRFPFVGFSPSREIGKMAIELVAVKKLIEGELLFDKLNLQINKGDKIGFVGSANNYKSALMEIISGTMPVDEGEVNLGQTVSISSFPHDNSSFFANDLNMTDWLRQYSKNADETYVRGFLGRMLFSGDESLKSVRVLSGGERVRCMLARMMLSESNILVLDNPTAHLDLESITALNNALIKFPGIVIFSSHDHEFINTIANRIIEFTPKGIIDKMLNFESYLNSIEVQQLRDNLYGGIHKRVSI